jgi:4-hydroxy-tetrahydrodipicolinate synthase
VPSRTNSNIAAETTLRLAGDEKNIVGIKEASGNFIQIMEIIKNKPKGFVVLSGDDALTLPMISIGAEGVISVVANAFPKQYSSMVNFALDGKYDQANKLHYQLLEIINALFEDGNPAGIKAALEIQGKCKNNLRLPLMKVNKRVNNNLKTLIENL